RPRHMLTRCPSCQTTFKVTSDILRVAEGQVRCGRCQYQFNALLYLQHPPGGPQSQHDTQAEWDHDEEPSIASRLVQSPRAPAPRPPEDEDFYPRLRRQSQQTPADADIDLPPPDDDIDEFSLPDVDDEPAALHEEPDADDDWPTEDESADEAAWPAPAAAAPSPLSTTRPQRQLPPGAISNQPVPPPADDIAEQQLIDQVIADTIAEE